MKSRQPQQRKTSRVGGGQLPQLALQDQMQQPLQRMHLPRRRPCDAPCARCGVRCGKERSDMDEGVENDFSAPLANWTETP